MKDNALLIAILAFVIIGGAMLATNSSLYTRNTGGAVDTNRLQTCDSGNVTVNTTTTQVLAARANRKVATFQNITGAATTIDLGKGTSATSTSGYRLSASSSFMVYTIGPSNLWTGAVHAVGSASSVLRYEECY